MPQLQKVGGRLETAATLTDTMRVVVEDLDDREAWLLPPGELGGGSSAGLIAVGDYVTDLTGATDQSTNLAAAIAAAEGDGETLVIPPGAVIRVDTPFACGTGPLTIGGGGTITVPGGAYGVIDYAPAMGTARTVTAQSTVDEPYSNHKITRLTLASGIGDFTAGDVVHLHSSQPYAWDTTVDKAEIIAVTKVDTGNGYLFLAGLLGEDYAPGTYTVVVRKMSAYRLDIDGLNFRGTGDLSDSDSFIRAAFVVSGCTKGRVRARFESLPGRGLVALACYGMDFEVEAFNLKDDASNNFYGYGATAMGSTRACRFQVRARKCRHAFTTNVYTRSGYLLWDSGAPRDNLVTGLAVNCTSAAWDTHAGAHDTVFQDCTALWNQQVDDDVLGSGRQWALQDRGCSTTVRGLVGIGAANGMIFSGQTTQYGRKNHTVVDGFTLRNMLDAAVGGKQAWSIPTRGTGNTDDRKIILRNGAATDFRGVTWAGGAVEVEMHNLYLDRIEQFRIGSTSTVSFFNCVRRADSAAGADEAVRLANGTEVIAVNYTQLANNDDGSLFRGTAASAGTATLKYAGIATTGTNVRDNSDGNITVTATSIAL